MRCVLSSPHSSGATLLRRRVGGRRWGAGVARVPPAQVSQVWSAGAWGADAAGVLVAGASGAGAAGALVADVVGGVPVSACFLQPVNAPTQTSPDIATNNNNFFIPG